MASKGIITNDPINLRLLAVLGNNEETRKKAARALTKGDHLKELIGDSQFWQGVTHSIVRPDVFKAHPDMVTRAFLNLGTDEVWWFSPALHFCQSNSLISDVWKQVKKRRKIADLSPVVLENETMPTAIKRMIAEAMLANPGNSPVAIIESIKKYMPEFTEWQEYFSYENLTPAGVLSICWQMSRSETSEMISLCSEAMSVLASRIREEGASGSYDAVSAFVRAYVPDEARKDAGFIADELAKIALSNEVEMIPSPDRFKWSDSTAPSDDTTQRNYCIYHIAMSDIVSTKYRKQAAKDTAMLADLKRYGHCYQDKIRFAEVHPSEVTKIFPVKEPGSYLHSTKFLQELCKVHGKKHKYIRDALAATSKSKNTIAILSEVSG